MLIMLLHIKGYCWSRMNCSWRLCFQFRVQYSVSFRIKTVHESCGVCFEWSMLCSILSFPYFVGSLIEMRKIQNSKGRSRFLKPVSNNAWQITFIYSNLNRLDKYFVYIFFPPIFLFILYFFEAHLSMFFVSYCLPSFCSFNWDSEK